MTPGIHLNVPADTYHALDCASSHRLRLLKRSPAHLRWELDNPPEQTPSMAFGEAVHYACLQFDHFTARYVAAPVCDRRTKEGKATWERFVDQADGRTILKRDDWDACFRIARAITEHPTASSLLHVPGPVEVTGVWQDGRTGQLCKMRADKSVPEFNTIVDLKTTEDASRDAFERSVLAYGYDVQAAMYLRGFAALDCPCDHFTLIAVEKSPPHGVAVYRLDDESVEAGDAKLQDLLDIYAECARTNHWPSYPQVVQTLSLPAWHLKQLSYGRIG